MDQGHKITKDGKYTCSSPTCTRTFTTLNSARNHSVISCPDYKGEIPKIPCPNNCGSIFRRIEDAKVHSKTTACLENPERKANPEYRGTVQQNIRDGTKYCAGCKTFKPIELFGKKARSSIGLAYSCYKCIAIEAIFQHARLRAKKEGITIDFVLSDIRNLVNNTLVCPVFGYQLQYGGGDSADNSATLDAFIHAEGHVKSNLKIISRRANTIKNTANINDMRLLIVALESWTPPLVTILTKQKRRHNVHKKGQTSKICPLCNIDKPLKEYPSFPSDKKTTLGVLSRCYRCYVLEGIFTGAQIRAKKHNLPIEIDKNYVFALANNLEECPILKIPLKYGKGSLCDNSATMDKVDPIKGYIPGNVWIISAKANRMKSDATLEEIRKVYDYMLLGLPTAPTPAPTAASDPPPA
jgi:hypothetical protein